MPRNRQNTRSSHEPSTAFQGVDRISQSPNEERMRNLVTRMRGRGQRDNYPTEQRAEIDGLYAQFVRQITYSEGVEQPTPNDYEYRLSAYAQQSYPGLSGTVTLGGWPIMQGCDCDGCRKALGKKPKKKKIKKLSKSQQRKIERTVMACQALL